MNSSETSTPDPQQSPPLKERLLAHLGLKLMLMLGLTLLFCVPYIYLANNPLFTPTVVPQLWLDHAIPFQPGWIWVYQSVYLLTAALPFLAWRRDQLQRYVAGYFLLTGVCFLIYLFFPTQIIRHRPAESPSIMFDLLWLYDGDCNALPSLHVGFLYFTLAFARRVYGPAPLWAWLLFSSWFVLIGYATLATKEHHSLDLVAGLALAVLCDRFIWRKPLRG
jgi:hypothetical protein